MDLFKKQIEQAAAEYDKSDYQTALKTLQGACRTLRTAIKLQEKKSPQNSQKT